MTFCMTFSCAILAVLPPIISNSSPWICSAPSPAWCIEQTPWSPADSLSLESLLRGVAGRQSNILIAVVQRRKAVNSGGEGDLEQDKHLNPKVNALICNRAPYPWRHWLK